MDTDTSAGHASFNQNQGMWKAYGLLYRLLDNGIPVHWAISASKTGTSDVDFTASSVRDLRTSTALGAWDYRGGPFIIDAADAAAARPIITSWWAANGNQPNVHEALDSFSADINVTLRSPPRIANDAVNASISIAYYNAAGIPDLNGNPWNAKTSPNILSEQQIADGGLFLQGAGCPQRRFDVFVTPHNSGYAYSLTDPSNLGTRTYAALDTFVQQGGGWTALCHSIMSNENALAALTLNGSNTVKALFKTSLPGGKPGGFLTTGGFPSFPNTGGTWAVHSDAAGLPTAQGVPTTATQTLPGGSVQTWPAPGNAGAPTYWPQTERIASFTASGGAQYDHIIAGSYRDGTGLGKLTYIGGHTFSTSLPYSANAVGPYLRAFYNSLFFNGNAVAKLDLTHSPSTFPQGGTDLLTANIVNSGGSVATSVDNVSVTLAPGFTYAGTTHGPEPNVSVDGRTLTWMGGLGDVPGGATAVSFRVAVDPSASGTTGAKQFAQLHATYGDVFGEGFTADVCREITVTPTPAPVLTKTTPSQEPVSTGSTVSWTLSYGNSGEDALLGSTLEDRLPPGFTYVSSSSSPNLGAPTVIPAASGTILRWTPGTLPANTPSFGSVTITTRAGPVTEGSGTPPEQTFTNNATLRGQDAAGNSYSKAASADVTVRALSLTLGKTVDQTFLGSLPGNVTYTLTPRSDSGDLLDNVRVVDPLPEGTTFVSAGQDGTYGGYTPSDASPGHDDGPPVLDTSLSVSTNQVSEGGTVTVTLNVTSSTAVTDVSPSDIAGGISGGPATCSDPSPASANVPAGGAGVNFTWTCTLEGLGEYVFGANAADAAGTTSWPPATSASVLSGAGGGPNVVAWNLGSNTPAAGGSVVTSGYTAGVYGLRGGGQPTFQKYDIDTGSWVAKHNTPANVNKGGALTTDGAGTIYQLQGDGKQGFNAYDIATDTWTAKATTGTNVGEGGALVYLEVGGTKYVFALMGGGTKTFKRYDVGANSWTAMTSTPANVKKGGALTTDGTYIYALQGDGKKGFWQYDPGQNSWAQLTPLPDNANWGAALVRVGNYIYATIGGGKNKLYRYDIAAGTWTAMANAPANIADGGAMTTDGTVLYVFQGRTRTFWRYDPATNAWTVLSQFTANTGQGGALVYDPGKDPHGRFSSLSDTRSLAIDGDTVNLTLTLSSTEALGDVVPGNLDVTSTGDASCSRLTGPDLVSEDNNIDGDGDNVVYSWTCTVAAGANPGSLTFAADASGTNEGGDHLTFAAATSNSTIVSPPLTYTVRVDPGAPNPVVNSGLLAASNQTVSSPEVSTFHGSPNLTIVKSNTPGEGTTVKPGDPITYHMTVENTGQGPATGVVVRDPVPDNADYSSCSGGDSCDESGGEVHWSLGTLAPGDTATVTFTVHASSSLAVSDTPYTISNNATVESGQTSPVTSNTVTNHVEVRPEFVKSVSAAEAGPGDPLTYTFTVSNPGDTFTADITDAVPDGTAFREGSCNPDCSLSGATVTWHDQSIPHGTSTFSFDVTVNDGTGGLTVTNAGTLNPSSPNLSPIGSNETDTDIGPELAIVKTNDPTGEVQHGDQIEYTLAVSNESNVTAHDVVVSDPLPPGTSFDHCTTPSGTCGEEARVVTFHLGDLDGHGTVTVSFTVTVGTPPVGTLQLTNRAEVVASNNEEPVLSNQVENPLPFPSLILTKSATPTTVGAVGDDITYHYVVTNDSTTSTLSGPVTVTDDRASDVSCPDGDLAPLASTTCTATYRVTQDDLDSGAITNTATAHAGGQDSNDAQAAVDTTQGPQLTLTKEGTLDKTKVEPDGRADAGDEAHYTLTAANEGNVTLRNVAISDPSLSQLQCELLRSGSSEPSATDQPADLAPGDKLICSGTRTLTQADIDHGSLENTVTAGGTGPHDTPVTAKDKKWLALDQDPRVTLTKHAPLNLAKVEPDGRADAGDEVNYTLTATNTGNVTLRDTEISDPSLTATLQCELTPAGSPAPAPQQVQPPPVDLAPGDKLVCTGVHTLSQADIDNGSVSNTATVKGADPLDQEVTDDDNKGTTLDQHPKLTLVKRATRNLAKVAPDDRADAGDEINYTLTATNDSNVTLRNASISDPSLPQLQCEVLRSGSTQSSSVQQPLDLGPGDQLICTGTHTLTQADIDTGNVDNTATVSGTDPNGDDVTDSDSAEVPLGPEPHLTLTKKGTLDQTKVTPDDRVDVGDAVDYTLTAVNDGNLSLSGVEISDPSLSQLQCQLTRSGSSQSSPVDQPVDLGPGDKLVCTGTHAVAQGDINHGSVDNTATVAGTDPNDNNVADSTDEEVPLAQTPHLTLAKTGTLDKTVAAPPDRANAGDQVHYTLTATNDGNVTLHGVEISDPSLSQLHCELTRPAEADASPQQVDQPVELGPGDRLVCTGTRTLGQGEVNDGHATNTATVKGTDPHDNEVTGSADEEIPLEPAPHLTLAKQGTLDMARVAPNDRVDVGDAIDYTLTATNDGNVTLSGVRISDPSLPGLHCEVTRSGSSQSSSVDQPLELGPGDRLVCTGTRTLGQGELNSGSVDNTATVNGTDPSDHNVTDSADEEVPLAQEPHLALAKEGTLDDTQVMPDGRADSGDSVNYALTATNDGNVTLKGVKISDPSLMTLHCELAQSGSTQSSPMDQPVDLAPGDRLVCTGSRAITQGEIDNGGVENTAGVDGTDPNGNKVTDTGSTEVSLEPAPHLTLTKDGTLDETKVAPNGRTDVGDAIDYTLTAVNDGNVTLTNVSISDPSLSQLQCRVTRSGSSQSSTATQPVDLGPGDKLACTGTHALGQGDINNGSVANTATVRGTDPNDNNVTDSADHEVALAQEPHLTLTKTGTLDETVVAPSDRTGAGDEVHYTLTAVNDGNVTLTGVEISDPALSQLQCELTRSPASDASPQQVNQPVELGPGDKLVCTGTRAITQGEINSGAADNTGTVEGTDPNDNRVTDSAGEEVPLEPAPHLTLAKQGTLDETRVAPNDRADVGDAIDYTLTATNDGNVTLHGVRISDPSLPELHCDQPVDLGPGDRLVCTGTRTLTQAEINSGGVDNTASVAGTDPNDNKVSDSADEHVPLAAAPHLSLAKQGTLDETKVAPDDRVDVGDEVNYTLTATNDGNVTLKGVAISDPSLSQLHCELTKSGSSQPSAVQQPTDLEPGDKLVCTGTRTIGQGGIDSGGVSNTATVAGTDPNDNKVTDSADEEVPLEPAPHLTLAKTGTLDEAQAPPTGRADAGDLINYTLTATNDGNVTLSGVKIEDASLSQLQCRVTPSGSSQSSPAQQPVDLGPGDKLVCTATRATTQGEINNGSVHNSASAAGTDPDGNAVTDSADEQVSLPPEPHLTLAKQATLNKAKVAPNDRADAGDEVTYTLTATNDGNVTLSGVEISDPSLSQLHCDQPVDLQPGDKLVCTGTRTITQGEIENGSADNTATVAGTDPNQNRITDTGSAQVLLEHAPQLTLTKHAAETSYNSAGDVLHYTYTVENTGNARIQGPVTVSDDKANDESCPSVDTVGNNDAYLDPGESVTCSASYKVSQAELDSGAVTNTATAHAAGTDSNQDEATVDASPAPHLTLTKEGKLDETQVAPNDRVDVGDAIDYTLTAVNDGNVTLRNVSISDPSLPQLHCDQPADLAPGDKLVCTGTRSLTQGEIDNGDIHNTATAGGTDPNDNNVTDSADDEVALAPAPHLTLTKQATLDETVAAPNDRVDVGDEVHYTLTATNEGNVTLSGVRISDPSLPQLHCEVTRSGSSQSSPTDQPLDLAPGDKLVCTGTRSIGQGGIDSGSVDNSATVNGTDPDGNKVTDTDGAEVPLEPAPHLTLTKQGTLDETKVAPDDRVDAGDVIDYTLTATNDGNVTQTAVRIEDASLSQLHCEVTRSGASQASAVDQPVDLAPGDRLVCTGTHTIAQGEINSGRVDNSATAGGTDPQGNNVTDSADEQVPLETAPALTLTKHAAETSYNSAGDVLHYTYTVENTGNARIQGPVTVSDDKANDESCPSVDTVGNNDAYLDPGESVTCSASYKVSQAELDSGAVTNTATAHASGTDSNQEAETVDASPAPHLTLTKQGKLDEMKVAPNDRVDVGDAIDYTLTAVNDGNVTLKNVSISDPSLPQLQCDQPADLAPGDKLVCTGTHTLTQADVDSGDIHNSATVAGTDPNGNDVTDGADDEVPLTQDPHLTLAKQGTLNVENVAPNDRVDAGDEVNYTLTATNDGNVTLHGVQISDPSLSQLQCELSRAEPPVSASVDQPVDLEPGDKLICTGTRSVGQGGIDSGGVDNTGTVAGIDPNDNRVTDTDSAEVPLEPAPHLTLRKQASLDETKVAPDDRADAGDVINYTLTAVNDGNATLRNVRIQDPSLTLSCDSPGQGADLAPGDTLVCRGTRILTNADIENGGVNNSATADGTDPNDNKVSDGDSTEVPLQTAPSLTLSKHAVESSYSSPGDVLHYTYTVTNTGNVRLQGPVTVTDSRTRVTCPPGDLAAGASVTCTASYTVGQADIEDGSVTNSATAHAAGTDSNSDQATVDARQMPHLTLTKQGTLDKTKVEPNDRIDAGDAVDYTLTAVNDGNVTLHGVEISDPSLSQLHCELSPAGSSQSSATDQPVSLGPGDKLVCTGTNILARTEINDGSVENTAAVKGTGPNDEEVTHEDHHAVTFIQEPRLTLVKQPVLDITKAAPDTRVDAGDEINYTLTAANEGNVTLTGVEISDPSLAQLHCEVTRAGSSEPSSVDQPVDLEPGDKLVCTGTHTLTQGDVNGGSVENSATVNGTDPNDQTLTANDDKKVTLDHDPRLALTKGATVDRTQVAPNDRVDAGDVINYKLTAVNDGNVTLTGVRISDPSLPQLTCELTRSGASQSAPVDQPVNLEPGDKLVCTGTHTITQTDENDGSVENTATVKGTDPNGNEVTDSHFRRVTLEAAPSLTLDKQGTLNMAKVAPNDRVDVGDEINYKLTAVNDGNVTLRSVEISDPSLPTLQCELMRPGSPAPAPEQVQQPVDLGPGSRLVCTGPRAVTQTDINHATVENTATVNGTGPHDEEITDSHTTDVPLEHASQLTLVKEATLDMTRVRPNDRADAGDVVNYTLTATNSGNTSLTTPALRVLQISDETVQLTCDPEEPDVTLEPGQHIVCTGSHVLTQTDIERGGVDNTGAVNGYDPNNDPVAHEDTANVSITHVPGLRLTKRVTETSYSAVGDVIHYTYRVRNTGNVGLAGPVTVSDSRAQVTCPPGDLAAGATMTCTATYTVTQADLNRGRLINTARARAGGIRSNRARARVRAVQSPQIQIVKSSNATSRTTVGNTVTFSFRVTNTGNVTITRYRVSDGLPGLSAIDCSGQPARLAPGDSATCTATYTINHGDVTARSVANSATVTGDTANAGSVDDSSSTTVPLAALGTLEVVKQVVPSTDSGRFDLKINGVTHATGVRDGGRTPAVPVLPDTDHSVSESAVGGTDLANYKAETTCTRDGRRIAGLDPARIRVGLGEAVVCTITNTLKATGLAVTKSAPPFAHDGDTITYGIRVSNTGEGPLHSVSLSDSIGTTGSRCQGGGPQFTGGDTNGDGILDTDETWTYSCTYVVLHADEDATSHIVNVVRVTATDSAGHTVGPVEASARTRITHPAIALLKTGPRLARPGDLVTFNLAVSNPGDTSFAESAIHVADPVCTTALRLAGKGNDPSPGTLDPGDTWTYRCSVQTASSDISVHNTASVQAADRFGTAVSASDSFDTQLTRARLPGRAKLTGMTGCVFKSFLATVRGQRIARVVFRLNGRVIKRVTNTRNATVIRVRINPARLRNGTHRLSARVTFTAGTVPRHRTLRLTFLVCRKQVVSPRFTG